MGICLSLFAQTEGGAAGTETGQALPARGGWRRFKYFKTEIDCCDNSPWDGPQRYGKNAGISARRMPASDGERGACASPSDAYCHPPPSVLYNATWLLMRSRRAVIRPCCAAYMARCETSALR